MTGTVAPSFDAVSEHFSHDYYGSWRGFVRQKLIQQNLEPLLTRALQVIDIGGGEGRDAIWLARKDHIVTVVEPSVEQQKLAERNFSNERSDVRKRLKFELGDERFALEKFGTVGFDLVLSHGVLMYQLTDGSATAHIRALLKLAEPSGYVSLVTTGLEGAKAGLINDQNFEELQKLQKFGKFKNHLGIETIAYNPEQIQQMIETAGGKLIDWYGIRVASDALQVRSDQLGATTSRNLIELEYELGRNPSTRGMGKMLQFIMQRQN
jgi:hypothetical protein